LIDTLYDGLSVNFFCVFPCRTCDEENDPEFCYSCYFQSRPERFLFQGSCLEVCPGYPIEEDADEQPICGECEFPCLSCDGLATNCTSCEAGYIFFARDNICYLEIFWVFPFLGAAVVAFLVVLVADCCRPATNFLHSLLFFLAWLEVATWGFLGYLWWIGEVEGDRSLSLVALFTQGLLNLVFMPVHLRLIVPTASDEYKQIMNQYKCSSYLLNGFAYILNFKMSVFLVSQFASMPRYSGTFTADNWLKFNIFAGLYICLVYLPFVADFYEYFTAYSLRTFASFVAIEAVMIMTIIALILLLNILQ
jgi:hypothetical protein